MWGHKSPPWIVVGAMQSVPRKVTLPGVSHCGDYWWAEAMRGLNISRISVREWSRRWAAGQNATNPIPQVVPPPVLRPPSHWKPFEKTLYQPHCRCLQTQTLPRITSRFANLGCLYIYFCLHLFACISLFFSVCLKLWLNFRS